MQDEGPGDATWADALEPPIRDIVRTMWGAPSQTFAELRLALQTCGAQLEQLAAKAEFFDQKLARSLVGRAEAWLAQPRLESSARPRRLVQVAIHYLILEDDAESDANSVVGFDDDEAVFNAVERELLL